MQTAMQNPCVGHRVHNPQLLEGTRRYAHAAARASSCACGSRPSGANHAKLLFWIPLFWGTAGRHTRNPAHISDHDDLKGLPVTCRSGGEEWGWGVILSHATTTGQLVPVGFDHIHV